MISFIPIFINFSGNKSKIFFDSKTHLNNLGVFQMVAKRFLISLRSIRNDGRLVKKEGELIGGEAAD